jgi:hypothetical protein
MWKKWGNESCCPTAREQSLENSPNQSNPRAATPTKTRTNLNGLHEKDPRHPSTGTMSREDVTILRDCTERRFFEYDLDENVLNRIWSGQYFIK